MEAQVTLLGVIVSLIVTIYLIIKKIPPAYGMITGALIGGIIGGVGFTNTIEYMIDGSQMIIPAVLRVLAAGVFAGTLIQSGAAETIARTIIEKLGNKNALIAIVFSTWILTSVGVFIVVSILIVAPIAVSIAKQTRLSKMAILLAMIGGGKAGNIMSPSPSAIAAADTFQVPLVSVIYVGIIPAIIGIIITCIIAKKLAYSGSVVQANEETETNSFQKELPTFYRSIIGPGAVIVILLVQPLFKISIDPLIILPLCGAIGTIAMRKEKEFINYTIVGLEKMSGVSVLLIGTGTLSGIISNSEFKDFILNIVEFVNGPDYLIAPFSGVMMSAATGTATSATVIASSIFSSILLELGIHAIAGAAMIHASSIALDHLPHSPFFHVTQACVNMQIIERLRLIPYETIIGLVITIVSTLIFGVFYHYFQ